MSKETYILRNPSDEKQTLGVFIAPDGKELFVAKTLELPDKNNQSQISCIPYGRYPVKKTWSPRYNDLRYEICFVPGRSGVRFDVANFANQLKGCVCMGAAHKDINADGNLDIIHSGTTIEKFNALMGGEEFWLNILKL